METILEELVFSDATAYKKLCFKKFCVFEKINPRVLQDISIWQEKMNTQKQNKNNFVKENL